MSPTEDLSDGFFRQIKPMSARLGCSPIDALKVWFNESIGIDATQQKAGHYGINQLGNLTGVGFTGTASEYMALGAEGQLPYVEKYYLPYKGRLTSAARLYQVNFLPATFNTVTTPDGILAQKDGIYGWAYDGNPSLDLEKKGYIVLDDLRKVVESAITNQRKWKDGSSSLAARWKEILERLAAAPAP
jgi:hypothetical protein